MTEALERCIGSGRQTIPAVKLVKRYLDTLQDGVTLVQMYDTELTPDAIADVRTARDIVAHQAAQLAEAGIAATNVETAAQRVADHLATERPWREVAQLADDLAEIRTAYTAERKRLIEKQEEEAEHVRRAVKRRDGFSTLTAEQAHQVMRPLVSVVTDTSPEAIAPTLVALRDGFELRLERSSKDANAVLDGLLSEGRRPMVRPHDLRLSNREVASVEDVEALVMEVREQLLEQIRAGARVRII